MGIGLSGMVSGLDTDTLIKQLMSAERTRVTKVENKITKIERSKILEVLLKDYIKNKGFSIVFGF